MSSKVIFNGDLLKQDNACIPVSSRGVIYGDGCFETFRSYQGRFLKLNAHLKRLEEGLHFLSIRYPEDLKSKQFRQALQALLTANNCADKEAVVRLQVWRKGGRGYMPAEALAQEGRAQTLSEACYSITATPFTPRANAAQLATVDIKRVPSKAIPAHYKLSGGFNYIVAAGQAAHQKKDEALLETVSGFVSETTIANIFWLRDEMFYTPSIECDILPGITRSIILELLKEKLNVKVKEAAMPVSAVKNADCVWLCNSLKEIQPVQSIDDRRFDKDNPLIQKLRDTFRMFREKHLK